MPAELLLAITAHGYGHLAQLAPVVAELRARVPDLRIRVRSALPGEMLRAQLGEPLTIERRADDFGMAMHSPFEVDVAGSLERYRQLHCHWEERVAEVAGELAAKPPTLLLADIPYLTLAAAERAAIPALALCSLNWADILRTYVDKADPEWRTILASIDDAYNSVRHFIQPTPSMPMPRLSNTLRVAPCVSPGSNRREEVADHLGLAPEESLVLVALGGFEHRLAVEQWPDTLHALPLHWLVPGSWGVERDNFTRFESLPMSFADLLASCDLLLTKPGYGTFAAAAANGIPLLYIDRGEWPEQPALVEWVRRVGRAEGLSRGEAERGEFAQLLQGLLGAGRYPRVAPDGAAEVAALVREILP